MHRIQSILPPFSPNAQHLHSDPQAVLATSCSAHCNKRRPCTSANCLARAPCTPPGPAHSGSPRHPSKTATPHPVLPAHRPGSPLLPPRQVCRLTLPPAPQPSPPGVRERVQPGSDIEQELHSLESILPVNKKEGKKSH